MESSSYSKTRSPARFLAAFLAVVMLFIFMPVLPVGAAGTINEITFLDVVVPSFQADVFFEYNDTTGLPNSKKTINGWLSDTAGQKNWGSHENLSVSAQESAVTISGLSLDNSAWDAAPFMFGLASPGNKKIYYSFDSGEQKKWTLLDAVTTTTVSGIPRNVYSIAGFLAAGNETEIFIKAMASNNVYFAGQGKTGYTVRVNNRVVTENTPISTIDETFDFTISGVPESETPDVKVIEGSAEVSPKGDMTNPSEGTYTYTVSKVTNDTHIQISSTEKTVSVSWTESGTGYTVNRKPSTVPYGGSLEFTVTTEEGYNAPSVTIKKTEGDGTVSFSTSKNGAVSTYTVDGIKEGLTVTITGASGKNKYKVTFPTAEEASANGYSLTATAGHSDEHTTKDYEHGQQLHFTVTLSDGWSGTPVVRANSQVIQPATSRSGSWDYVVTVTNTTTIEINNLTQKTYTVKLQQDSTRYTLDSLSVTVVWGGTATFRLTLQPGYTLTENAFKVSALGSSAKVPDAGNVKAEELSTGVYSITIDNVKDNYDLTVSAGIEIQKYTISVTAGEGSGGKYECTGLTEQIDHGEGRTFTVTPNSGYRIKSVVYTDNKKLEHTLATTGGGRYTIQNVVGEGTVTITVEAIVCTVTYNFTNSTTGINGRTGNDTSSITLQYTVEGYKVSSESDYTPYERRTPSIDFSGVGYTLTLESPKRQGWNFKGWTNAQYKEVSQITWSDKEDHSIELTADWTVNTTTGSSDDMFFYVDLETFTLKEGTTNFAARVHTNLSKQDQTDLASQVSVVSWGFFYGENEEAIKEQLSSSDLCKFLAENAKTSHTYKYSDTNLYYYKFPTSDQNAMTDGATFKLHLKGTEKNDTWYGAAWVVLTIGRENYLFVSTPKPVTNG